MPAKTKLNKTLEEAIRQGAVKNTKCLWQIALKFA